MRLFVSLNPDPALLAWFGEAQRKARAELGPIESAIRWVRPEAVHLTLAFLGETGSAAPVEAALGKVTETTGPLAVEVGGWGCFPNVRRPAVLWMGIVDPTGGLTRLHRALAIALSSVTKPERRPFSPHLTLGRVRPGRGDARLGRAIASLSPVPSHPWNPRGFALMESRLDASGVTHHLLAEYPL